MDTKLKKHSANWKSQSTLKNILTKNPIATGTKQIGKAIKSPWVKTTLGKAGYKLSNNLGKVGGTGAFLNLLPEEKPLLDLTQ